MVSPNTSWVFSFISMFLVKLTSFPASTASSADSFKLVLNSTDGRPLCAVNQPDNVFTFDGSNQIWNSGPSCLPDSVQCSWMCRKNSSCTAFNYRSDSRRCEFFTGSPQVCTVDTRCTLFRVSRIYCWYTKSVTFLQMSISDYCLGGYSSFPYLSKL